MACKRGAFSKEKATYRRAGIHKTVVSYFAQKYMRYLLRRTNQGRPSINRRGDCHAYPKFGG